MNSNELASIAETLLFIVGEPLEAEDIKKVTGATEMELWQAIELLEQKYTGESGILLKKCGICRGAFKSGAAKISFTGGIGGAVYHCVPPAGHPRGD